MVENKIKLGASKPKRRHLVGANATLDHPHGRDIPAGCIPGTQLGPGL